MQRRVGVAAVAIVMRGFRADRKGERAAFLRWLRTAGRRGKDDRRCQGEGFRKISDHRFLHAFLDQTLMHATWWPGRTTLRGGGAVRQSGPARGQRVLKTQPVGGVNGLGSSPVISRGA